MNRIKKINAIMELVVEKYEKDWFIHTCCCVASYLDTFEASIYKEHIENILGVKSVSTLHFVMFARPWGALSQEQKEHATMARLFALESFK